MVSLESIKTVAVLAGRWERHRARFWRAGTRDFARCAGELLQRAWRDCKNLDREVRKGKLTEAEKPQCWRLKR